MVRFVLQIRCVESWSSRPVEPPLFYICNDPDYLPKAWSTCDVSACSDIIHSNLRTDRIVSWPVRFR